MSFLDKNTQLFYDLIINYFNYLYLASKYKSDFSSKTQTTVDRGLALDAVMLWSRPNWTMTIHINV